LTHAQTKFEEYYAEEKRDCGLRVTSKDKELKTLWLIIHWVLYAITLTKQNRFYDGYVTTFGRTVYFPAGWTIEKVTLYQCATLKHEARHVRQFTRWGLGSPKLGIVIMGFFYLFLPLPVGFAWFRFMFEREAYKVSYYAMLELGLKPNLDRYINQLSGPDYFWTWVIKTQVREWFLQNCHPALALKDRA
jgi:hypothetical protein